MRQLTLLVVFLIVGVPTASYSQSNAKLTLQVVDEQGAPVEGAKAYISFSKPNDSGIGVADILKEGMTGKDGLFTAESYTMNSVGLSAEKKGYYHSSIHYEFKSSSSFLNRWEPWNPTIEVVLKKKRNPVPMYQKYLDWLPAPKLNEQVGYDLEVGDWVSPYGKGLISDFVFDVQTTRRAWTDYESSYTLTFSNVNDGIQEYIFDKSNQSSYKWPFEAPEEGYVASLQRFRNDSPQTGFKTNEKKDINYIFRVRTKTDKDGKIIAAKYGKIEGEIRVIPDKIQLFYVFNPDGTKNLENDNERNLFKKKGKKGDVHKIIK